MIGEKKEKKSHKWDRAADEWYVETVASVEFLIARERFRGLVYDPCAGRGTIPETFIAAGIDAIGTDLRTRKPGASWFRGELDFWHDLETPLPHASNIVMNPPFYRGKGLEAFIRRALKMPVYKVAVFVPVSFLFGEERAPRFYDDIPPSRVWPVYPRPSCPPGVYLEAGGKPMGGSSDFVWLVWDRGTVPGTTRVLWSKPERPS